MFQWPVLRSTLAVSLLLSLALAGCGGGSSNAPPPGTSGSASSRLVFVVSSDLEHNEGEINPDTANLSGQGLQHALLMAGFLRQVVLAGKDVDGIYALEPATHPQTAKGYPDLVPLEIAEQFALLNRCTVNLDFTTEGAPVRPYVAQSFPVNVSYTAASLPAGAAPPPFYPPQEGQNFQGLDFLDNGGGNEKLAQSLLSGKPGATYVLVLPFETLQTLLVGLKSLTGWNYEVPTTWQGPDVVYTLTPQAPGQALLAACDARLNPGPTYPVLTQPYRRSTNLQVPTVIQTSSLPGSSVPAGMNTNQTVYFLRHAEAHPEQTFEDGNLVLQGDWRALYLPQALEGRVQRPDEVYAWDPAQPTPGSPPTSLSAALGMYSYIRPSQTIAPYAIANGLPLCVPTSFAAGGFTKEADAKAVQDTIDFFFTGGRFSNKTLLVDWEHDHIVSIGKAFLNRYLADPSKAPAVPSWESYDYDTVWSFTLDGSGNLTFSNLICEGIDSASLPTTPPTFVR